MKKGVFIAVVLCIMACTIRGSKVQCQAATRVTVSTYKELKTYMEKDGDYEITIGKDIEIPSAVNVIGDKVVYGNGKCLYRSATSPGGYLLKVANHVRLTIKSDLFLSGNADAVVKPTLPLIRVGQGATLRLGKNVDLYNNYSDSAGGAIYNTGMVYIEGANIYNCRCNTSGGAIQQAKGAECYMSAGRIYGNWAAESGGAIKQFEDSIFCFTGGRIDSNTCLADGAAIQLRGRMLLKGTATIDENNDIYILKDGIIRLEEWTAKTRTAITSYPEVGRVLVNCIKDGASCFVWSAKQSKPDQYPLCNVHGDLYIGTYYNIRYYAGINNQYLYQTQRKQFGKDITLLTKGPEEEGYSFAGWYISASATSDLSGESYSNNHDFTLYAHYVPNAYTVTLQSMESEFDKVNVIYHDTYGQLREPSQTGYAFTGWYLDEDCTKPINSKTVVMTAANHTLYAGWSTQSYQVFFDANGGTANINTRAVVYDKQYGILPIPTKTGYDFVGWFTDKTGGHCIEEASVVAISTDHTLYARWRPCKYMVSFDACGGKASFQTSVVTYNSSYGSLPNATRTGYKLSGWYTKPGGGSKCSTNTIVMTAANHVLYARWVKAPVTVKKITISGIPTFYKERQSINTKKARLVVLYSNNTKKVFTKGWKITSYKKTAGKRSIQFSYGGKSCRLTCTWLSKKQIAKIHPTKSSYVGYQGSYIGLKYPSAYQSKLTATYSSSNRKVVMVSKKGVLKLCRAGTAYITVNIRMGNISKKVKVKVTVKKAKLITSYSYKSKWNYIQFKTTARGTNKKPVYTSSNSRIASVNKKTGLLKGVRNGTVTITIKAGLYKKTYRVRINTKGRYITVR